MRSTCIVAYTHVVYGINEWIVAAVAHGEPIETEPYDVDVGIPAAKSKHLIFAGATAGVSEKKIRFTFISTRPN